MARCFFLYELLCIPLAVALAFGSSMGHGFAPIDDQLLVTGNLAAHGPTMEHVKLAFTTYDPELYIPFTLLSYQFDYLISGLYPWMYHLTNLLLHSLNGIFVALIIAKLTRSNMTGILGGILFAIHPIQTEAVVWIAGRKDLLAATFFLASWLSWIGWRETKRMPLYVLCALLFVAALLSKVSVISLPLLLVITDILEKKREWKWNDLLVVIPHAVIACVFAVIAAAGKERLLQSQSIIEVVLVAFRSSATYVGKLFWPHPLALFYEWHEPVTVFSLSFALPIVFVILLLVGAYRLRKEFPLWTYAVAYFFVTLGPTFFGSRKAGLLFTAVERYAYLPSIGFALIISFFAIKLFQRQRMPVMTALAVIVLSSIATSYQQTHIWSDPKGLFEHALDVQPRSLIARIGLSDMLLGEGKVVESFDVLKGGLKYGKDVRLSLAAGRVYAKAGDIPSAREQFTEAISLDPTNPDPLFSIASLDEQEGEDDAALAGYLKAVELDSSYVSARNGIARISLKKNDPETAERELRTALEWNPSSAEAHRLMAELLTKQERTAEANTHQMLWEELQGFGS